MAITFTYGVTSIVVNRNPSFGSQWWKERINSLSVDTADGGRVTYDNGPNIIRGTIELIGVSKAEGDSLRSFIESTVYFGTNSITITPASNTDLGAGLGTALTSAYLDINASTDGVFEFIAPGRYNIRLKYRVVS